MSDRLYIVLGGIALCWAFGAFLEWRRRVALERWRVLNAEEREKRREELASQLEAEAEKMREPQYWE